MQAGKKIVFISHSQYFHGAEICLLESVKAIIKHYGHSVQVVIPGNKETHLGIELKKAGAVIHYIIANPRWVDQKLSFKQKWQWIKQSAKAFVYFRKLLKREKPDLVISNSVVNNPAFALASRFSACRFAWYIHELGDLDHGYTFYLGKNFTFKIIRALSDKIIFNSDFTRQYFTGGKHYKSNRVAVIDYAVELEQLNIDPIQPDKFADTTTWNLLIAGRTVPGKGQEDIIIALGILKNKYQVTNFHLTVLGQTPGPYNDKLLALIDESTLRNHVDLVPFTENTAIYFQKAHIGITTSRNEAFGRITVEYMKSNMIAVGADAGGTSEIIENNETGILYKLKDHAGLAVILKDIMQGRIDTGILRKNAYRTAHARFNGARHAETLVNFLVDK